MLRREIHDLYRTYLDLVAAGGPGVEPLTEDEVLSYAKRHEPFIAQYAPDLLDEMQGIAEGARIAFSRILALNCVAEVRRLRWPDVRRSMTDRQVPDDAHGGCTCLSVQGEATGREVILAQTYDIEPIWTPIMFRIAEFDEQPEALVFSHAGILCQAGMNAAGISLVASAIRVSDQQPGVPAPLIARMILQTTRLGSAADALVLTRRTVGIHYVIASEIGILDVETTATRHAIRYVDEPVFTCSNHIQSASLASLSLQLPANGTYVRDGRMRRLLNDHAGRITPDVLKICLSDHADHPHSICSHAIEGVSTAESRAAVILRPAQRVMLFSDGPPCSNEFMAFQIESSKSVFRGE
jgi:isopenicillin-N N-acyltransferase-like protein